MNSCSSEQRYAGGPPRIVAPPPSFTFQIPGPPQRPPDLGTALSGGMALTSLVFAGVLLIQGVVRASSGSTTNQLMLLSPLAYVAIAVFSLLLRHRLSSRAQRDYENRYTEALNQAEVAIEQLEEQQRAFYRQRCPSPQQLLAIASGQGDDPQQQPWLWRLFARMPHHSDFLELAVGKGERPSLITFRTPDPDPYHPDVQRSIDLAVRHQQVRDVLITVTLPHVGALGVTGSRERCLNWTRTVLTQVATLHHPRDVRIAAFFCATEIEQWTWLSRLPHNLSLNGADQLRLLAACDDAPTQLSSVLADLLDELGARLNAGSVRAMPAIIVVVDQITTLLAQTPTLARLIQSGPQVGIYSFGLTSEPRHIPAGFGGYINLADEAALVLAGEPGLRQRLTPLAKDQTYSNAIVRALLGHAVTPHQRGGLARTVRWLDLVGMTELNRLAPLQLWQRQRRVGLEPVVIGIGVTGELIVLDLNETHTGIFAMTGGGKSQLLTTLALALTLVHSPDKLNLLCIDFKGRATFRALHTLPHVIGEVSDLDQEASRRALIAVEGELARRKAWLDQIDVPDIATYEQRGYPERPQYGPLPYLVIFIEEFAALLDEMPEFSDRFIKLANQGRSLGVLMILSSQHAASVPRGLRSNIGNWIALRVNDPDLSRSIIGVPDAATISKRTPGRAYLLSDGNVTLLQTGIVTLPEPQASLAALVPLDDYGRRSEQPHPAVPPARIPSDLEQITQIMVAACASGYAAERYRVWFPALPAQVHAGALPTPPPAVATHIAVPLGLLDLPRQAQQPLWLHCFPDDGSLLFLSRSSQEQHNALCAVTRALVTRYSPQALHLYHLDRAGAESSLWSDQPLPPHLGASVAFDDALRIQQLFYRLRLLLEQRRSQHARAQTSQLEAEASIVVLCAGLEDLCASVPEAEALLSELLADGAAQRIFVVATARTWTDLPRFRDRFQTLAVLRMAAEQDAERLLGSRRVASTTLPLGRGYLRRDPEPLEFQLAAPSNAAHHPTTIGAPQPLPQAPVHLRPTELIAAAAQPTELPLAVNLIQGSSVKLAPSGNLPHLLIAHEGGVSPDGLLMALVDTLLAQYSPAQLALALVDFRRSHLQPYCQRAHTRRFNLNLSVSGKREPEQRELSLISSEEEFRALIDLLLAEPVTLAGRPRLLLLIRGWEVMRGREAEALKRLLPYANERGIHLIISGSDFGELLRLDLVQNRRAASILWLGMPPDAGRALEQLGLRPPRALLSGAAPPAWGYLRQADGLTIPVCFALAETAASSEPTHE